MEEYTSSNESVIANIDHIKQVNYAAIYKVIEKNAPISRVDVAKVSKLAPASVTKITRQLLENGLLTETARQASTGGRRAISLELNASAINVLAIKIGRKQLSIGRYNLAGVQLFKKQVPVMAENAEQLLAQLLSEIELVIVDCTQRDEKISAITLTHAGLIDPIKGVILYSSRYSLENICLVELIQTRFNIPAYLGNHTRCLALAEHYFGASQDCKDSILISIHHGVGSGIIMQGKRLLGEKYNIGEIGHIQVNPAGKQCHCGNFGCLETEVSDDTIIEKVQEALNRGAISSLSVEELSSENIYQAAADGDPLCQKIVTDMVNYLGKTVAILINILNPEKIIISGKITLCGNLLFSTLRQSISQQTLHAFREKLQILPTALAENPTIAAFALAKQAIYEGDLLQKINNK
ncbi:ROK family transcriptional regulator [Psychromonas sp. MME2]|uniref:ROK family transcriptional regulator n=1 Tax=unclassified Psychromonas TaxID=2614957 RepID=UPI00339BDAF5